MSKIINGVWQQTEVAPRDASGQPEVVDRITATIASIVVAARDLSDADHTRVRNTMMAAGDLMLSRDRLKPEDRARFEAALRDAVAKRHGL